MSGARPTASFFSTSAYSDVELWLAFTDLLSRIEKTCMEFLTLFLQVLDEGRLTDGQGRLIDFR